MANQQNSYTGSQGTGTNSADFAFTFPSFTESEVKVEVDNVVKTLTTHYTVVNHNSTSGGTVRFTTGNIPTGTTPVRIFRQTDVDNPKATFTAGSSLKAGELNDNFKQVRHALQEAIGANATDRKVQPFNIEDGAITSAAIKDLTVARGDIANDAIDGTKIADDSIDSEHYVDGSVDTQHIANENITTAKLAPDAVTASKLADNAVVTANIVDANVTHVKLANDAVDGDNIADDSINSEHYVDGSIDTAHIADLQVTTAKIAADAVTGAKIADDQINSEHYVDGSIDTAHIADAQITTAKIADGAITDAKIAGGSLDNRYYTETELDAGQLDNRYYTEAESDARYFNISTGDTIKDGDTFPDNDTTIATTAAINDRIIDLVDDVGGFVPIANETSFPTANPDVNNGAGTLVSIKAIGSTRTPSTGTVTIANGAGTGNTVTITGCGSTVLTAGFGVIVETTTTLHTYAFHRLVPKATEVTTVAGIASNVTTVGNNTANINTVAGNTTNINTVAANNTNVTNVGSNISNVNAVHNNASNINTVAGINANVTTVAGISANVTSVANNSSNINSAVSNASNINSAVSNASNINTVAGSIANVNTTATNIANVNTTASNIANVNNFANTYQIASSNPTTDGGGNALAEGDLYFNTTANELKVYNGGTWQGGVTASGNFASTTGNTFTGHNIHNDNVKSVFGTSSDGLEIYHSGTDSIIDDTGTGNLRIRQGGSTKLQITSSGTETTGNISVTGTVDGRDVAADGTKLDGISSSAIANVVQDTTPQLGGDLDVQSNKITTATSNGNVKIEPNGTGVVEVRGAGGNDGTLQLNCSQQSHGVKIKSPAHSANASYTLTLPTTDGNNHELLKSDGSGNLSWTTVGADNIATNGVTEAKIATDAVTVNKIAANSVTTAKIADGNVTTAKIADDAVTHDKLDTNSVQNAAIATGAVATDKIADQAVTLAKLPHGTSSNDGKFLRANNGADPTFETVNTDLVGDTTPQLGGDLDTNSFEIKFDDDHNAVFGNDDDLKIKHSGSNGNINNYTGDLVIRTLGSGDDIFIDSNDDVSIRTHATDNAIKCIGDGGVELYHDSVKKLETQSDGVRFLDSDSNLKLQLDTNAGTQGIIYADSNQLQLQTGGGETSVKCIKDGGTELYHDNVKILETQSSGLNVTGNVQLNDGYKSHYGNGQDLKIYHSSDNNSYIEESGTGSLVVKADDFYVQNAGANHTQIKSDSDNTVQLSFNGTAKIETTTDGAKVLGTGNFVLPSGTTAQRGSAATGSIRYNTTTNQLEVYNGSAWSGVGASSPQIYKVTNTTTTGAAGTSMVITGEDFVSGATVHYMGGDGTSVAAGSVSFNSSTQLTAVSPALLVAGAPYSIKVTNPDGGEAVAAPEVEVTAGAAPAWTTASGQIGSNQVKNVAVSGLSVAATDADGAVTYSETTSVLTSNANTPAATMNLSLNSSTGAITGTAPNVTSDTTYNFTLRATDTAGNTVDRNFNIVVLAAPAAIYWFRGTSQGGSGTRSGTTWSHTGYNPNASGGGNANSDRLRVYGNGTGGTYAGFHHFLYSNAITIPVGHDRCDMYVSSVYTNNNGYRYNQGNSWTTSQPSGNSHGSGAFGAKNMGAGMNGLNTYTVPSNHQGVTRYWQMFVFGGQNGVQYQEVTLLKTYNVNNP